MNRIKATELVTELFGKITPSQRLASYWYMKDMDLTSHAKAPTFYDPNKLPDVEIPEMVKAFEALSIQHRVHTVLFIISDIAAQFQETINLCKDDPNHLDKLDTSTLREVALYEHEKATANLLKHFHKDPDVLLSLERLAAFGAGVDDHTPEDLVRLKSNLMDVWTWQSGTKLELPALSEAFQGTIKKAAKIAATPDDQTPG